MCVGISRQRKQAASAIKGRRAWKVGLATRPGLYLLEAVEGTFGMEVDFSQLVKLYGQAPDQKRSSPAQCIGCRKTYVLWRPRSRPRLHILGGAPEPHHADEHAALHPADQCLLQEGGERRKRPWPYTSCGTSSAGSFRPSGVTPGDGRSTVSALGGRRNGGGQLVPDQAQDLVPLELLASVEEG